MLQIFVFYIELKYRIRYLQAQAFGKNGALGDEGKISIPPLNFFFQKR